MFARCTICLDSLGRRKPPLSTACGHLYCRHCAERHFINGARCAMCRDGPYRLHQLIRLFPDYETDSGDGASSSSRGSTSAVTTSRPQDTASRASSQLGRQSIAQLVTTCIADLLLSRRRRGYQIPAPPTTPVSRTPPRYSSIMNQRLLADVANMAEEYNDGSIPPEWLMIPNSSMIYLTKEGSDWFIVGRGGRCIRIR